MTRKKYDKEVDNLQTRLTLQGAKGRFEADLQLTLGLEFLSTKYNIQSNQLDNSHPTSSFVDIDEMDAIYVGVNSLHARNAARNVLRDISKIDIMSIFVELGRDYGPIIDIIEQRGDDRLYVLMPPNALENKTLYKSLKDLVPNTRSFIEMKK